MRSAEDQHVTQYFEMFGNRGIYHEGWTAVTRHSIPWLLAENPSFDEDVWELYDTTKDWSQANDLSKEMPKKLQANCRICFWSRPPNTTSSRSMIAALSASTPPSLEGPICRPAATTMTFYPGMTHLMENTVLNVKNRSHTITAEVEIPEGDVNGVIIAQGGRFAGWSLYVKGGAAKYCHNFFDVDYYYVGGEKKLPTGTVNIRYHFNFEGDAPGGGGTGTLFINDEQVAEGNIRKTVPFVFSADENTRCRRRPGSAGDR